ncbi:MAG: hypothetical protein AB1427_01135 [Thermodesulfobacteriota bacterium]
MYWEKRPTCITVIGWVWIVIGGLMCFSAVMALYSHVTIGPMAQGDPEAVQHVSVVIRYFPAFAIVQIAAATVGIISGIYFLKLKRWSRQVLEILTWLLLLFFVGFGIYWVFSWIWLTQDHGPRSFGIMGAVAGVVITGIYSVSLGIMLKYLRGDKVRNAIAGGVKPE